MSSIEMGLIRHRHHLAYGWRHGWGQWLPTWAQDFIVTVWNRVACRLLGHEIYGPFDDDGVIVPKFCSACCKEWP